MERGFTWQLLIGPNVQPWRAFPASAAARGCLKAPGCQSPPYSKIFKGLTVEEVMEEFSVTREQVSAVLEFAAKSAEAPAPRACNACDLSLTMAHPDIARRSTVTRSRRPAPVGWEQLENGALLKGAEAAGFDCSDHGQESSGTNRT